MTDLEISKEWCRKMAELEGGSEGGAGRIGSPIRRWDTERQEWICPADWKLIDKNTPWMKNVLLFAVTERDENGKCCNWRMGSGYYSTGHDVWIWEGEVLDMKYQIKPTHWTWMPDPPEGFR